MRQQNKICVYLIRGGEDPRRDVAVVIQFGDDDVVALFEETSGDAARNVHRQRRHVGAEYHLRRRAVKERRRGLTRRSHPPDRRQSGRISSAHVGGRGEEPSGNGGGDGGMDLSSAWSVAKNPVGSGN